MNATCGENSSCLAYQVALVRLQELASTQQDDSAEAVQIRDAMDGEWNALTAEERRHLKGLSADLFMLDGAEVVVDRVPPSGAAEWSNELERLVTQQDWEAVLRQLRSRPDSFSDAHVAYLRGRAYGELGELEAASAFFAYAQRLQPENSAAAIFALNAHERAGHWARAASLARSYLKTPHQLDPRLVITSAAVLQSAVDRHAVEDAEPLHREILDAVQEALKPRSTLTVPKPFAVLAHVLTAHAAFSLGDLRGAEAAYTDALNLDPNDAELYVMRGQVRSRIAADRAREDFQTAVSLATLSAVPYLFLAQLSARQANYTRAIELAERALTLTENPRMRSEALHYLAIAKTELGAPTPEVRAIFERAMSLDSSNRTLGENYSVFQRRKPQMALKRAWVLAEPSIPPLEDQMLREGRSNEVELALA